MIYSLPGTGAAVVDYPVAFKSGFTCDLRYRGENSADGPRVAFVNIRRAGRDMFLRDNDNVHRRLRRDVAESKDIVILINLA